MRCTAADLQRAAEERDEAQACVTRLQGEKLDLQEAVDSRCECVSAFLCVIEELEEPLPPKADPKQPM